MDQSKAIKAFRRENKSLRSSVLAKAEQVWIASGQADDFVRQVNHLRAGGAAARTVTQRPDGVILTGGAVPTEQKMDASLSYSSSQSASATGRKGGAKAKDKERFTLPSHDLRTGGEWQNLFFGGQEILKTNPYDAKILDGNDKMNFNQFLQIGDRAEKVRGLKPRWFVEPDGTRTGGSADAAGNLLFWRYKESSSSKRSGGRGHSTSRSASRSKSVSQTRTLSDSYASDASDASRSTSRTGGTHRSDRHFRKYGRRFRARFAAELKAVRLSQRKKIAARLIGHYYTNRVHLRNITASHVVKRIAKDSAYLKAHGIKRFGGESVDATVNSSVSSVRTGGVKKKHSKSKKSKSEKRSSYSYGGDASVTASLRTGGKKRTSSKKSKSSKSKKSKKRTSSKSKKAKKSKSKRGGDTDGSLVESLRTGGKKRKSSKSKKRKSSKSKKAKKPKSKRGGDTDGSLIESLRAGGKNRKSSRSKKRKSSKVKKSKKAKSKRGGEEAEARAGGKAKKKKSKVAKRKPKRKTSKRKSTKKAKRRHGGESSLDASLAASLSRTGGGAKKKGSRHRGGESSLDASLAASLSRTGGMGSGYHKSKSSKKKKSKKGKTAKTGGSSRPKNVSLPKNVRPSKNVRLQH